MPRLHLNIERNKKHVLFGNTNVFTCRSIGPTSSLEYFPKMPLLKELPHKWVVVKHNLMVFCVISRKISNFPFCAISLCLKIFDDIIENV